MKNKILKTITAIAAAAFIFGGVTLDSNSDVPFIVCMVSLVWISLFMYANRDKIGGYGEWED